VGVLYAAARPPLGDGLQKYPPHVARFLHLPSPPLPLCAFAILLRKRPALIPPSPHQLWTEEARPPHEVLAHLLEELEDLTASFAGSTSDCATTPLITPPEDERDGGGGRGGAAGGARDGGGRHAGEGGKKEGLLAEAEAFVRWSHHTGELQNVPPLESVDLPGEKGFTEGCLKVGWCGVILDIEHSASGPGCAEGARAPAGERRSPVVVPRPPHQHPRSNLCCRPHMLDDCG